MRYQLLFCLSSEDTGTVRNPALVPVLDAAGLRREFTTIEDAYSTLNRLLRLAAGLSYYVTPIVDADTTLQPAGGGRGAETAVF